MRTLIRIMAAASCAAVLAGSAWAQTGNKSLMISNGLKFLNVPYVEHVLDEDSKEDLIINCDEMDCTTFVEYTLAMSLSPVKDGQVSEGDFARMVQKIRYRDGKIDGYASRLHYMSDWIDNGLRNGFLTDITAQYSSDKLTLSVDYMTTHAAAYKRLASSPENVARMKEVEKALTGKTVYYLPKDKLPVNGLPWIQNGDIIAITTDKPGLDIAHMGLAFYVGDKLGLLHASSESKKVEVSPLTLSQLLDNHETWTGIRVIRMSE